MKIFNDIRNFINDSSKIIIYDNLIDIINFKEIKDISSSSIKILSTSKVVIEMNNIQKCSRAETRQRNP